MNPIVFLGQILFSPWDIAPDKPFQQDSLKLRAGLVAGMLGLGIVVAWLSPEDFIGLGWKFENALLVNKALGFSIGFMLPLLLFAFEYMVLTCFKFKGVSGAIRGATGVFLLVPFVVIPLHSFFPNGVTASGYPGMFWVLAITFISWHVMVLGFLMCTGHFNNGRNSEACPRNMVKLCIALASCEIVLSIIVLALFPLLFRLSMAEFLMEWI